MLSAATYSLGGVVLRSIIGVPRIPSATPPSMPKLVGVPKLLDQRIVPGGVAGGVESVDGVYEVVGSRGKYDTELPSRIEACVSTRIT